MGINANPTNVVTGTKFPQIQPGRTGRNETGTFTDVIYETTDFNQAKNLALLYEINGIMYNWEQTFGKQKLTAFYPYNFLNNPATEPPVDLWELNYQTAQKNITDSSNTLANACTQGELYLLGLFQQNVADYVIGLNDQTLDPTPYPLVGSVCYPETLPSPPPAPYTVSNRLSIAANSPARTLANLMASGVTTFDVFVPQLKHTRTINSAYPIKTPFVNVGSIISTASIYALESIPDNVLFTLPDFMDPTPANGKPVLQYGWYKGAPQVNQIARLKFQILETWEYGLWPVDIYGTPL